MQFHSPTLFRKHDDDNITTWFDVEKFMRFQHDAVTRNGWMDEPPCPVDKLVKSIQVIQNNTRSSWMELRRASKNIRIDGFSGKVEIRVKGDINTKDWITRCIALSQCIGVGSRTSMGFGHCSVTIP